MSSCIEYNGIKVYCFVDKVEIFNKFFYFVFSRLVEEFLLSFNMFFSYVISDLICIEDNVVKLLVEFEINKLYGFDNIFLRILKVCVKEFVFFFVKLFNIFLSFGNLFSEWKVVNVVSIYKLGDRVLVINYRFVLLISVVVRLLERLIYKYIMVFFID